MTIKRINNLEFRKVEHNDETYYEIIRWFDEDESIGKTCYTVAQYKKDKEGHYLKFVGDRPFGDRVDPIEFWNLAEYGQQILNAEWKLEYKSSDRF